MIQEPWDEDIIKPLTLVPGFSDASPPARPPKAFSLSDAAELNAGLPACHLLGLPAELRVRIYEYVFSHARTCFINFAGPQTSIHWVRPPALSQFLRTCRTIYREAQPTLLTEPVIDFHFGRFWEELAGTSRTLREGPDFHFLRGVRVLHINVECNHDKLREGMLPALFLLLSVLKAGRADRCLRLWAAEGTVAIQPSHVAGMLRIAPRTWKVTWDVPTSST
ncbi:hypothetical protein LTR53_005595 [Teratosphaeriaceae sp. CCFEE 6253]|nr:hypothetical protein LTR53_005595 [Teratosphaeriaceae sp. CCFEE 6253]